MSFNKLVYMEQSLLVLIHLYVSNEVRFTVNIDHNQVHMANFFLSQISKSIEQGRTFDEIEW
jgi:hypothetical protein